MLPWLNKVDYYYYYCGVDVNIEDYHVLVVDFTSLNSSPHFLNFSSRTNLYTRPIYIPGSVKVNV